MLVSLSGSCFPCSCNSSRPGPTRVLELTLIGLDWVMCQPLSQSLRLWSLSSTGTCRDENWNTVRRRGGRWGERCPLVMDRRRSKQASPPPPTKLWVFMEKSRVHGHEMWDCFSQFPCLSEGQQFGLHTLRSRPVLGFVFSLYIDILTSSLTGLICPESVLIIGSWGSEVVAGTPEVWPPRCKCNSISIVRSLVEMENPQAWPFQGVMDV